MAARYQRLATQTSRPTEHLVRLKNLLDRSAIGDEAAFAELHEVTRRRVYGLVLRVTRSPDHAAEVTQEVYLDVWRQAARHDPTKGNVLTWMTTIAHRRAVDRVRSVASAQIRDSTYAASQPGEIDHVFDDVVSRADATRVRSAVALLSMKQREALTLAYFSGRTQTQIADQLSLPLGTVKTRIRTGLAALATHFAVTDTRLGSR